MLLSEACERISDFVNIPFVDLFTPTQMEMIVRNKGKTGQLLELLFGLTLTNANLDFEDGELKTNKCDARGNPLETVFITQISRIIDELIERRPFEHTHLYEKIDNLLYVPVCKVGHPDTWMFLPCIHVDLTQPRFRDLRNIWRDDYYHICDGLRYHIENSSDGYIHTTNGVHLQIRSKDTTPPYNPIYSRVYGRYVSNKNHAFYFQKSFVYDIRRM